MKARVFLNTKAFQNESKMQLLALPHSNVWLFYLISLESNLISNLIKADHSLLNQDIKAGPRRTTACSTSTPDVSEERLSSQGSRAIPPAAQLVPKTYFK